MLNKIIDDANWRMWATAIALLGPLVFSMTWIENKIETYITACRDRIERENDLYREFIDERLDKKNARILVLENSALNNTELREMRLEMMARFTSLDRRLTAIEQELLAR